MADPNQSTRSTAAMDITSFTSIKGVFFGMGFMLYCMCVGVFLGDIQKRRRPWRQTAIAFAYCSMMVSFGLTDLATNTAAITWAFTDNNGSTQAALAALTLANGAPPVLVVWKSIAPFLLVALPAPMQIWRVRVIWTASSYVVPAVSIPCLTMLTGLVMAALSIGYFFISPNHAQPHFLALAYFLLCALFNLLVSSLIVGRLMLVRRRVAKIIGPTLEHSSSFTSITAIFIESYTLIAVSYLAVAISAGVSAVENPVTLMFISINGQMEMLGYLLAFHRVLSGRAWTKETECDLSMIQFSDEHQGIGGGSSSGMTADGGETPKTAMLANGSVNHPTHKQASLEIRQTKSKPTNRE